MGLTKLLSDSLEHDLKNVSTFFGWTLGYREVCSVFSHVFPLVIWYLIMASAWSNFQTNTEGKPTSKTWASIGMALLGHLGNLSSSSSSSRPETRGILAGASLRRLSHTLRQLALRFSYRQGLEWPLAVIGRILETELTTQEANGARVHSDLSSERSCIRIHGHLHWLITSSPVLVSLHLRLEARIERA